MLHYSKSEIFTMFQKNDCIFLLDFHNDRFLINYLYNIINIDTIYNITIKKNYVNKYKIKYININKFILFLLKCNNQ